MSDEALLKFKKIYRAKNYMDDMRQGIDPVSKLPVPADSVIRQEKVINCFNFISALLDEMLNSFECEQGAASDVPQEESKPKKVPFHLQDSQISQIKMSRSPLAVSTFTKRINDVVDKQSTKSIRAKDIQGWLTAKGFLVEQSVQIIKEEKEYIPSANASDIGVVDIINQRDKPDKALSDLCKLWCALHTGGSMESITEELYCGNIHLSKYSVRSGSELAKFQQLAALNEASP